MGLSRLVWSIIYGLIAGFITYVILFVLTLPTQPWSLLIGVLVGLGYFLPSTFPSRNM